MVVVHIWEVESVSPYSVVTLHIILSPPINYVQGSGRQARPASDHYNSSTRIWVSQQVGSFLEIAHCNVHHQREPVIDLRATIPPSMVDRKGYYVPAERNRKMAAASWSNTAVFAGHMHIVAAGLLHETQG